MTPPLLLSGRWVIVSAWDVRSDHTLLVQNGRVVELGPRSEMRARYAGLREIGGDDCAILPGFINAHHHCYGVELANQGIHDDFLEPWMFNSNAMVSLSPRVATAHAALRLLHSGVTAVVDMCAAGSSRDIATQSLIQKAAAYQQVGIRAAIAPGERWQNRIIHGAGEQAAFLASLPSELRARLFKSESNRRRLPPEAYLEMMSELVAQNNGHQDYWFGPTGPQWTPTDLLKQISVEAERLDTRIQTHALESHYENLESPRTRGEDVLPYLDRIGFLTERLSLAHAVWTTKKDIKLLQTRGVQVSHNPGSNLRLRSGIAPAAEMFTAGIPVGIGMDGTSLAGDEDMFAEIRLALALNRPPHVSGPALTARHALQMATEHGAGLMGREHELGCLRPGFYADALVLDLERLTQPWISPEVCPVALIVGRAKASDLRHVVVNGELRLQDRRATGLNEKALMAQICVELTQTPPTDDARQLQQDLRGYLMRWYASWDAVAGLSHPPVSRYGARPFLT